MQRMTDQEFYEFYGRMPRRSDPKKKKKKVKVYWGRIIAALIVLLLMILGIVKLVKFIAGKKKGGEEPSVTSSAVDKTAANAANEQSADAGNNESAAAEKSIGLTVCIDAAHGGFDKGTQNDEGRCEKDDTLRIAQSIKAYLESCGVKVVMTRTDDNFIDMDQRCNTANEQKADVTISIHRSSTEISSSDIHGFEAYVHTSVPAADKAFAEKIMSKLEEVGISENKGVHAGYPYDNTVDYPINQNVKMPSVLLDMGFLTSSIDNQLLDANIEAYSSAIGNAIIETATELGVIDASGTRLAADQLLSDKPAPAAPAPAEPAADTSSQAESSQAEDTSSQPETEQSYDYEGDAQQGYDEQWQENQGYEQNDENYVDYGDVTGYSTDPMMTE
ncbi:MAG: N-acetylmuramoyl-L-alanine amidase [Ruminococcus sp.]|nr:N-acetylmuramoyl-L-alanine amidase [Ruminococcus sp.]